MSDPRSRPAVRLDQYRPPDWGVDQVELDIALDRHCTEVHARLTVRRRGPPGAALWLDAEALELLALYVDGQPLDPNAVRLPCGRLRLDLPGPAHTLHTRSRLRPSANTRLEGLYVSGELLLTQCEAEGFRRITPYIDRPDVLARFRVRLIADAQHYPVLLANGNPVGRGELDDGRHWALWEDPHPKPAYLFAIAAGPLECIERAIETAEGRPVMLRLWSDAALLPRLGHALDSLERALRWDEREYGRCYDLEVYNVVAARDFNMGAMENKGLNIFNARYLAADRDSATDADFEHVEAVVAHEYFHNWTGNRITCRDWFQLSLKEGLTVFRDQCYMASRIGAALKRIADVRLLRSVQFAEDSGPLAHPVRPDSYEEINNFYTATVYEKGAEIVRMLHTLLGPEDFRRGMDLYFARHDGQAVTVEDFLACLAEASGQRLDGFMSWYTQAGTPRLRVEFHYDPEGRSLLLDCVQSRPPVAEGRPASALPIPLRIGLLDAEGRALPLKSSDDEQDAPTERVLLLERPRQSWRFHGIDARPVPSLLRGFSAPVLLSADLSRAELAVLARHDSDAFNRWEALQKLLEQRVLAIMDARLGGREAAPWPELAETVSALLADPTRPPAWVAECLSLPEEAWLAERLAQVDVDALWSAREALRLELAQAVAEPLAERLAALGPPQPWSAEPEARGRRRLRLVLLGYQLAAGLGQAEAVLTALYRGADNMTERLGALGLLARQRCAIAETLLADFERRYRDDPLSLDKWFALKATVPGPAALDTVRALLGHPAFTLRNPNRVRAVLGSFARDNRTAFHRADGMGYRLLAEQLEQLDALNPQVAARLATVFQDWHRYDARRQRMMVAEMERLRALPGLSVDLGEILNRALAA